MTLSGAISAEDGIHASPTQSVQRTNLILNERLEWADHQRYVETEQSVELKYQRFAKAGRQDANSILSAQ